MILACELSLGRLRQTGSQVWISTEYVSETMSQYKNLKRARHEAQCKVSGFNFKERKKIKKEREKERFNE